MPWRGLEPRRLAAPPPQDGVSTNFTTRATLLRMSDEGWRTTNPPSFHLHPKTGATGLEPATSRVTVECSNQTELRPPTHSFQTAAVFLPSSVFRPPVRAKVAPTGIEPVSAP